MAVNEVISTLFLIYSSNPLLTFLQLANLLISIFIAKKLIGYAVRLRGKSLSFALRYLAYAFFIVALISIIQLLSPMPWFDWNIIEEFAFLFFLLVANYAVGHIARTVEVYAQLKR